MKSAKTEKFWNSLSGNLNFCVIWRSGRIRFFREQLLEEVWGYEYYRDIRTVDVTVRRLREKLEDDSSSPRYIMTKRGIGYYFRRP